MSKEDYSLKEFEEWLEIRKDMSVGVQIGSYINMGHILEIIKEFKKSQVGYILIEEPDYYAVLDTKTNEYIIIFNKGEYKGIDIGFEAYKYVEYLNNKEDD